MPIGAAGAAIITAAGTLAGTGANVYASGKMNKKTREWNDKQYARTRADALADYATQNEYNSPLNQMQRFRDAGLNPNLIYGQTNEAAPVRSADAPAWNPRAPNIDLNPGPAISAYFNTKMQEAQIDNLRAGITAQNQQTLLTAAQTQATLAGTDRTRQDIQQAQSMNPMLLEAMQANIQKTMADTQGTQATTQQTIDNNERQAMLTASSIREAAERIGAIRINNLKTQAETSNTKQSSAKLSAEIEAIKQGVKNAIKEGEIKEESLKLLRRGQNPNDPTYLRILGEIIEKHIPSPKQFKRSVDSTLNERFNLQRWRESGYRK